MFGTIRKHQTWLWLLVIGITVVSMLAYFGMPTKSGNNSQNRSYNYGSIDGKPITETEYRDAMAEAKVAYFFNNMEWPDKSRNKGNFDEQRDTYVHLARARLLQKNDIRIDPLTVAQTINFYLREFSQQARHQLTFDEFDTNVLRGEVSAADFERFVQHELGIHQLVSVVGASGNLVTPQEIQSLYEREYQEFATEAVFFSGTNYLAEIPEPTPAALATFYTNEMSAYRIPDRRQLSYVHFNVTNFLAAAQQKIGTNIDQIVETNMRQITTNYLRFAKTPEEARAKIREDVFRQEAFTNAYTAAVTFQNELLTNEQMNVENLVALAKAKNLPVQITEPFDRETGPKEFDPGAGFGNVAFSLSAEEPFGVRPYRAEDGFYIVAFAKELPTRVPPLDEIRARATVDYKREQAILLARQKGAQFALLATNAVSSGKTFEAVAAEAKVKSVPVPPLSLRGTRELPIVEEHLTLDYYKQIVYSTPPGKVSDFHPTQDGGVVAFVRQRMPVDPATMKANMPSYMNFVRRNRQQEAFNQWFNQEALRLLRDTPIGQAAAAARQGAPRR